MATLVVREPGRVAVEVKLVADFTVGRDADNGLVLSDPHVSRRHARFVEENGRFRVADHSSTHGVLVNGAAATDWLKDGDVIQIGRALLTFRADSTGEQDRIAARFRADETQPPESRRLRVLYQVSRAFGDSGDPDELLSKLLTAVLDVLGCERGLIGLTDGGPATARRIAQGRDGADVDQMVVSRSLLETLLRGESILVRDAEDGPPTIVREGVRSAMGAPLRSGSRVLGFIYLDDRARADRFAPEELEFLTALAHLTAAALEQAQRRRRDAAVAEALRDAHPVPQLLGASETMRELRARVRKFAAAAHAPVLLRGESGTGKELVARTLHDLSPRAAEPFVTVNCAAIPDNLIESDLFGHERGAFTGALKARGGKFALADGGTLFLDEVGDLSLPAQAKLLRALQEGEIQPVGSDRVVRVDVRVVSATNKSLPDEIAAGRFREDLYYRLSMGEIELPPLRDRGDDVVLLAGAFAVRAGRRVSRSFDFTDEALAALRVYGWPGNVRQLQNEVERAVILAEGDCLELAELRARIGRAPPAAGAPTLAERFTQLETSERALVAEALAAVGGNIAAAARLLGISRIMLRRRVERFGITGAE